MGQHQSKNNSQYEGLIIKTNIAVSYDLPTYKLQTNFFLKKIVRGNIRSKLSNPKVPISYFQGQFSMSKIIRIFLISFSLKNINSGAHFFKASIFKSLYFLKWCPILDTSPLTQFSNINNFLWVCWFLGKNLSNFVSPVWKLHTPYCHITLCCRF